MNAIINLNHFCEIHGPQTIFSTQTIREKSLICNSSGISNSSTIITNPCYGCGSIGSKVVFMTEDKDSSIRFVSSEKSMFGRDNQNYLITLRSLSTEITVNSQEGLVYFGDSRLNSLCFTFKVKDCMARGFEKLYSIVIVMKDKMFLLNTQPFLSNNIKDIAKQIQESAQRIYENEQKQFPQRPERLNTGKASNVPPRSLKELTGESNIFAHLHSMFSWVLWSGSRYYTETLTLGVTPPTPAALYTSQIDKEDFLSRSEVFAPFDNFNLRSLKSVTGLNFQRILYYSLVGMQIVIRGDSSSEFGNYFKDFLPYPLHRYIVESTKYSSSSKSKILCLPRDAVVVANNVCRVDLTNDKLKPSVKCSIDLLPAKLPALMVKILNAVDENMFSNGILNKFIRALVEEWKNKVICLSHQHDDMSKLKKTLGIQAQDEMLINYWLSAFQHC